MNSNSVISEGHSKIQDEEECKIRDIFQFIVCESGENVINQKNLQIAVEKMGLDLDSTQIESLITKIDIERNGYITQTEFREMMINNTIVYSLQEYQFPKNG